MKVIPDSPYGHVTIAPIEELFMNVHRRIEERAVKTKAFSVGLTGGSTPKVFYKWVAESHPFSPAVLEKAIWSVSDERMVPLADEESNFGNADRGMLQSLQVEDGNKFPWPVQVDPHSAPVAYAQRWQERFGINKAYDLCILGMGDDGHTASIFPGSPLLSIESADLFTSVEVPGKGWRLTITPRGFSFCDEILILVTGEKKASILKEVLEGKEGVYPVQLLSQHRDRVHWLVDEAAASQLTLS